MTGQLQDKVIIVTGAASGQGAAEARLFIEEGARVVLTDISSAAGESLAKELGENAHFITHDVTSERRWTNVVDETLARFGRIDALVNNAGIVGYRSIDETDSGELQRFLNVHLFGAYFGIRAVLPPMRKSGSGVVVNISSTAALRGYASFFGYGVSKWALRGLSRYAAVDLANSNIRVNTILPGGVETPMLTETVTGDIVATARAAVPMKRFARAQEIASVALFLCSDASSYLTGSEIVVDGGLNA
jgi:3alpha(or 20beta)-hydroxysteroid dehydrogenase